MSLAPGDRISTYQIVSLIGAGGMGQVFLATDTKLDRQVALKVLPEGFASDTDRLARFTREAKTLASLNHPNIAQVYDAGREGATAFMVMELVEGEDLSARLARSAMPVGDALSLARQVADALAAAHDAGVVHRDLKPANIKMRDDGTVKVLDFGLAKGAAGGDSSTSDFAATMTSPAMTAMGVILGTAAYMAPEQAKGKPVDRRADVWAFGVVLHEMLSGARLFGRDDVTDTLAAVLTHEPDFEALPPSTPPQVRRLLARCLSKDKRARLDSMTVARMEIDEAIATPAPFAAVAAQTPRRWPIIAAGIALAAFAAGWLIARALQVPMSASEAPPLFSYLAPPDRVLSAFHDGFALSPDGGTLAFTARDRSGARQIWTRRLSAIDDQPVRGTEGGTYPFWSPDGSEIGFFVDGKMRRVPAEGGNALAICDAPGLFPTGSWQANGLIVFATYHDRRPIMRKVAATGGQATELSDAGPGMRPMWIDGQRFVFIGGTETEKDWGIRIASISGGASRLVEPAPPDFNIAYDDGFVFLNRNDALVMERLDAEAGALVGPAVAIAGLGGNPKSWFAISAAAGRLAGFVRRSSTDVGSAGDPIARLRWVSRDGEQLGTLGEPGRYWTLRLSPNGNRVAVSEGEDLLLMEPGGARARITAGKQSWNGVWSPNGSELVFSSDVGTGPVRRRLDIGSTVTPLENARGRPNDWSNDGVWILVTMGSSSGDIFKYHVPTSRSTPWLATPFHEQGPRFSTDGKWVAFSSDESGRSQIYVRAFDGDSQAVAVSVQGGMHPAWRRDGRELYFVGGDGSMMAVDISTSGGRIAAGRPRALFRIPMNDITSDWFPPYDVSPDGQRFLLNISERPEPLLFLQGLDAMKAAAR